jgi:ABC-2 type transport system permease protein
MQLSNWRWSWRAVVVTGTLTPVMSIVAFGTIDRHAGTTSLGYILTGSLVLSLMFQNQSNVANNFAYMKAMGTLDFFATLPVYRFLVIMATVAAFLTMSIPSLIVTVIFGSLFLKVPVHLNPLLILVVPLSVLPLAAIGALIGVSARTPEEANSFSLLVNIVLLFTGPVIIPAKQLPHWLIIVSYFSVSSHASSALRNTLLQAPTSSLAVDIGYLLILTAALMWIVGKKMKWRWR